MHVAVIGTTTRVDTVNLLDKRIKSRFSSRQVPLPSLTPSCARTLLTHCLALPPALRRDRPTFADRWDAEARRTIEDRRVVDFAVRGLRGGKSAGWLIGWAATSVGAVGTAPLASAAGGDAGSSGAAGAAAVSSLFPHPDLFVTPTTQRSFLNPSLHLTTLLTLPPMEIALLAALCHVSRRAAASAGASSTALSATLPPVNFARAYKDLADFTMRGGGAGGGSRGGPGAGMSVVAQLMATTRLRGVAEEAEAEAEAAAKEGAKAARAATAAAEDAAAMEEEDMGEEDEEDAAAAGARAGDGDGDGDGDESDEEEDEEAGFRSKKGGKKRKAAPRKSSTSTPSRKKGKGSAAAGASGANPATAPAPAAAAPPSLPFGSVAASLARPGTQWHVEESTAMRALESLLQLDLVRLAGAPLDSAGRRIGGGGAGGAVDGPGVGGRASSWEGSANSYGAGALAVKWAGADKALRMGAGASAAANLAAAASGGIGSEAGGGGGAGARGGAAGGCGGGAQPVSLRWLPLHLPVPPDEILAEMRRTGVLGGLPTELARWADIGTVAT
jgi:hypothetical protein